MKALISVVSALTLVAFLGVLVQAEEGKETKLEGKITCCKCDLKKADKCTTAIVVKKGDKETVYVFDKDAHAKYHDDICKGGKEGTVTGTVATKDGKSTVKVSKVEYKDK
jgi:hypothetical protein